MRNILLHQITLDEKFEVLDDIRKLLIENELNKDVSDLPIGDLKLTIIDAIKEDLYRLHDLED